MITIRVTIIICLLLYVLFQLLLLPCCYYDCPLSNLSLLLFSLLPPSHYYYSRYYHCPPSNLSLLLLSIFGVSIIIPILLSIISIIIININTVGSGFWAHCINLQTEKTNTQLNCILLFQFPLAITPGNIFLFFHLVILT